MNQHRKMKVKLLVPDVVFLDKAKLPIYGQEIADRLEIDGGTLSLYDLVNQAILDGDIAQPADDWEVAEDETFEQADLVEIAGQETSDA